MRVTSIRKPKHPTAEPSADIVSAAVPSACDKTSKQSIHTLLLCFRTSYGPHLFSVTISVVSLARLSVFPSLGRGIFCCRSNQAESKGEPRPDKHHGYERVSDLSTQCVYIPSSVGSSRRPGAPSRPPSGTFQYLKCFPDFLLPARASAEAPCLLYTPFHLDQARHIFFLTIY
jgi:hypothetical protein